MTSNAPGEEGPGQFQWLLAFTTAIVLASVGTIVLVWIWSGFPGRAEVPGWWPRVLTITTIVLGLVGPAVWLLLKSQPRSALTRPEPVTPTWWGLVAMAGIAGMAAYIARHGWRAHLRRDLLWGLFYAVLLGASVVPDAIRFVREGGPFWPQGREWLGIALLVAAYLYVIFGYVATEIAPVERATALLWMATPMGAVGGFILVGRRFR